jgi:dihydrofolate synthase/folylpolyglutamate synthase
VIGVLDDKDAAGMLRELLGSFDRVVFTRSAHPRSLPPATLMTLCEQLGGPPAEVLGDPRAAVERARALAGPGGAVLATGSIYLVADLVREDPTARASVI